MDCFSVRIKGRKYIIIGVTAFIRGELINGYIGSVQSDGGKICIRRRKRDGV